MDEKITELELVRQRTLLLFNPFHSKKDGRFTTKTGGSASAGGGGMTKKEKVATGTAAAAGGVGGAVAGGLIGGTVAGTVGGIAAMVFEMHTGKAAPDFERVAQFTQFAQTLGAAGGATVGAFAGAKAAKGYAKKKIEEGKKASDETESIDLSEGSEALKSLLSILEKFLQGDKQRFAFKKSQAPWAAKIGFKESGEYLYADKPQVEKLVAALKKFLAEKK